MGEGSTPDVRAPSRSKYVSPYEVGRLALISDLVLPPGNNSCTALDVGCGPGVISERLQRRGWHVTAVDADANCLRLVAQYADHTIQARIPDVLAAALPGAPYGLLAALEIIEHLTPADGERLLNGLRAHAALGAVLLLSTPNRYSPEGLSGWMLDEVLRRRRWTAWDDTHVTIYSARRLLRMVSLAGWQPERVLGYWYRGRLPKGLSWRLPLKWSDRRPFNYLGFNTIVRARLTVG
jgi:2-polyprenyl-3-methyl-5-hydroxy-6-metoxy-1,4-benzoquinol methylase